MCCCVTVTVTELILYGAVLLLQHSYGVLLCYSYSIDMVCCCVTVTVFILCVAVLNLSKDMLCSCVTVTIFI